jgi:hypothetical protein
MGWLNEIQALPTIRQRISAAARQTGWDVYTFHTQHNLDHFFDTTITAMRDTWANEGSLSRTAIIETKRRFATTYDYHLIQPRLIENLVFQSSLMEWTARRAQDVPLEFHVIGTSLLSALVAQRSIAFDAAVSTALKIGARWDSAVECIAQERAAKSASSSATEVRRQRFGIIDRVIQGREPVSFTVATEDLCRAEAPARPFWFSPVAAEEPIRIETARDAAIALESLNLNSWMPGKVRVAGDSFRGWLISPLHGMAKMCRWSVSNYLLATPSSVSRFIHDVASGSSAPIVAANEPEVQNRFRLSRIKVTGP